MSESAQVTPLLGEAGPERICGQAATLAMHARLRTTDAVIKISYEDLSPMLGDTPVFQAAVSSSTAAIAAARKVAHLAPIASFLRAAGALRERGGLTRIQIVQEQALDNPAYRAYLIGFIASVACQNIPLIGERTILIPSSVLTRHAISLPSLETHCFYTRPGRHTPHSKGLCLSGATVTYSLDRTTIRERAFFESPQLLAQPTAVASAILSIANAHGCYDLRPHPVSAQVADYSRAELGLTPMADTVEPDKAPRGMEDLVNGPLRQMLPQLFNKTS